MLLNLCYTIYYIKIDLYFFYIKRQTNFDYFINVKNKNKTTIKKKK